MKVNRVLLALVLATVSFLLILGQFGGVAASATPDLSVPVRPAAIPEAELPRPQPKRATSEASVEPAKPPPALVAQIPHDLAITAHPGRGKVIGTMPEGSRYYDEPLQTWILDTSSNARFGKVTIPYSGSRATGWIRIAGLDLARNPYSVRADLSRHVVRVMRLDKEMMRFPAATGAPSSPTPAEIGRAHV